MFRYSSRGAALLYAGLNCYKFTWLLLGQFRITIPAYPTTVVCFCQFVIFKRLVALFAIRKSLVVTFFTITVAAFVIRFRVFDNFFANSTFGKIPLETLIAKMCAERFNPPHVVCVVVRITTFAIGNAIRTVARITYPSSVVLMDTGIATVA